MVSASLHHFLSSKIPTLIANDNLALPPTTLAEIEKLSKCIKKIAPFVEDVESKQRESEKVRAWLREIEGIAYGTDDALDSMLVRSVEEQEIDGDGSDEYPIAGNGFEFQESLVELLYGMNVWDRLQALVNVLKVLTEKNTSSSEEKKSR